LADIIFRQFAPYVLQRTAEKSDLFQSGIVFDADLRAAGLGGTQVDMPHWNDLSATGSR